MDRAASPARARISTLSDQLLAVSALMDRETVRRTLNYLRGFRKPEPHVLRLIRLLGDAQNIQGLQLARKTLTSAKWKDQRQLIDDALVRAASFAGADVRELVSLGKEPLSAFAASWFLWRDGEAKIEGHMPPVPDDLIRERYRSLKTRMSPRSSTMRFGSRYT